MNDSYPTRSFGDWVAQVTQGIDTPYHQKFRFDCCVIRVQSNSQTVIEALSDYYCPFVDAEAPPLMHMCVLEKAVGDLGCALASHQPEPGKARIKEEYCDFPGGRLVRKRLTHVHFLFGGDTHIAFGPCAENLNQIINFINNRYIQWRLMRGCLLFHAAGVARRGSGLAIAGFSGRGKSTLALHVLSAGMDFISNDRLMVERGISGLRMHGLAKYPRVNPGTILHHPALQQLLSPKQREQYEQLPEGELWNLEHKHDVILNRHFDGSRQEPSAKMHGLVILNWNREDTSQTEIKRVHLAQRRDLLPAIMKRPGIFLDPAVTSQVAPHRPEDYIQLLEDCPVYEMRGKTDFETAVQLCLESLPTA